MDPMYGGGGLTPEQLQAFMEYSANQGAFTEQDRAVQQQIAQAAALDNKIHQIRLPERARLANAVCDSGRSKCFDPAASLCLAGANPICRKA